MKTYDYENEQSETGNPFPGVPVYFEPTLDDSFVIYVDPINSEELSKMRSVCRRGGDDVDVAKLNRLFVRRVVKGWTGLTPEQLRDTGIYSLSAAGVEKVRADFEADNVKEMPFSPEQAVVLMKSTKFNERVTLLGTKADELQAAREAYQGKASRR